MLAPWDHIKAFPIFSGILGEQECGCARERSSYPPSRSTKLS